MEGRSSHEVADLFTIELKFTIAAFVIKLKNYCFSRHDDETRDDSSSCCLFRISNRKKTKKNEIGITIVRMGQHAERG